MYLLSHIPSIKVLVVYRLAAKGQVLGQIQKEIISGLWS